MTQQSNQLQEDGYSIDDFKSGKVEADLKALSGVNDTNLGRPNQTPQSTFDEKLEAVLTDAIYIARYGDKTARQRTAEAKAAITSLVLEERYKAIKWAEEQFGGGRDIMEVWKVIGDEVYRFNSQQRSIITKESE